MLGMGEGLNWPGASKTVAEWFPRQERSLAVAIFDSGSSVGGALAALGILVSSPARLPAAEESDGIEFFETRIRPTLVKYCYKCHSSSTTEPKGGLRLDSREGIRKGGDSGAAVVPMVPWRFPN